MNRFLVQVNKDGGYANITNNKRYQNHLWHQKPRDAHHGEVKIGDELVIYCTGSVPDHGKSIVFSAVVLAVSDDNITFELGNLCWFPAPLGIQTNCCGSSIVLQAPNPRVRNGGPSCELKKWAVRN